jgi:hypothetical protein
MALVDYEGNSENTSGIVRPAYPVLDNYDDLLVAEKSVGRHERRY